MPPVVPASRVLRRQPVRHGVPDLRCYDIEWGAAATTVPLPGEVVRHGVPDLRFYGSTVLRHLANRGLGTHHQSPETPSAQSGRTHGDDRGKQHSP